MRRILALLILLAIPAVAQFGGPMGGMRPGSMQGGGLLPGRGGDPLWVAAGPTKPTLDFDFAKRKDLTDAVSGKTSLVNFSRSAAQSPGTYVGADGLIHDAAVNLALYSEQFENAAWTKRNSATVTANQTASPDGKQTAEKIVFSATNSDIYNTNYTSGVATASVPYVPSFYLKKISSTGTLYVGHPSNGALYGEMDVDFSLLDDGWNRIFPGHPATTVNTPFVTTPSGQVGIYLRAPSSAGLSMFLWGAQLEEADPATMQPTAYIKTTSQALAAPRFDHVPTTGNVTTNLQVYSEMFDQSSWVKISSTITPNTTTSPSGDNAADTFTLNTNGTGASIIDGFASSAGQSYTASVYAKAGTADNVMLTIVDQGTVSAYCDFDLTNGTIGTAVSTTGQTIESVGDGWYRISISYVFPAAGAADTFYIRGGPAALSGENFYLYGAQLEASPTPGPYVRTLSETRSISDANAESLGLLVEEARANLIPYSENLNGTGWNKADSAIVSSDFSVSPDGTQTADLLDLSAVSGSAANGSRLYYNPTPSAGIFSFYAKSTNGNGTFPIGYVTGGAYVKIYANLTSEWTRFSFSIPYTDTVAFTRRGDTHTETLTEAFIWGVQWEAAATFPTSYIPTTGSSQTRYADVAAVQDEDFSTTNLLAYSESFDVGWTKTADVSFSANAIVSPDGQTTAEKFEFSGSSIKRIYRTGLPSTVGVFSVYAKAGEETTFSLWTNGASRVTIFDLSSASVVGSNATWSSIKPVGDGWYLCQHYYGGSATTDVNIYGRNGSGAGFTPASNGDGLYLWGASLTATEYPVEYVTTRNLLTDSQDFERGTWSKVGSQINNDIHSAPDGTLTADEMQGTVSSTSLGIYGTSATVVSGATYNISAYFKYVNRQWIWIRGDRPSTAWQAFDIQNGVVGNEYDPGGVLSGATITDVGGGWYRTSFNITTTSAGVFNIVYTLGDGSTPTNGAVSLVGTEKMAIWGAQLEPGTTATDYVRTVDVVGKDYQWYEPTEGTAYAHSDVYADTQNNIVGFDYNSTNTIVFGHRTGGYPSNRSLFWIRTNAVSEVLRDLPNTFSDFKIGAAWKYNDANYADNGTLAASDTNVTLPIPNRLSIGRYAASSQIMNGHIRRLTYWPRRQADSTLQVITQ